MRPGGRSLAGLQQGSGGVIWIMAATVLILIGLVIDEVVHQRRTPPELGPIRREPRAYDWTKEQDTW
jgi:hypothetical protein